MGDVAHVDGVGIEPEREWQHEPMYPYRSGVGGDSTVRVRVRGRRE
jgi:hypothetical protein